MLAAGGPVRRSPERRAAAQAHARTHWEARRFARAARSETPRPQTVGTGAAAVTNLGRIRPVTGDSDGRALGCASVQPTRGGRPTQGILGDGYPPMTDKPHRLRSASGSSSGSFGQPPQGHCPRPRSMTLCHPGTRCVGMGRRVAATRVGCASLRANQGWQRATWLERTAHPERGGLPTALRSGSGRPQTGAAEGAGLSRAFILGLRFLILHRVLPQSEIGYREHRLKNARPTSISTGFHS